MARTMVTKPSVTLLDCILGLTKTTGDIRLEAHSLVGQGSSAIVTQGVGYAPQR